MKPEEHNAIGGPPAIGLAFLARGLHPDWRHAFERFVTSYERFPAGIAHRLYIIFKGFLDETHLAEAQRIFSHLTHVAIHTGDAGFDIGCYQRAALEMTEESICFLNTKSEILASDWLLKLARQLARPGVGLVGNTGSYESIRFKLPPIPPFPNPHIRTNAFLIRRELFSQIANGFEIRTKNDGWLFECGPNGFSRQVLARGLQILVVDRKGDAYEPAAWRSSNTYRTPDAAPLVGDDAYRAFVSASPVARRDMMAITWGPASDEARVRAGLGCEDPGEPVEARGPVLNAAVS